MISILNYGMGNLASIQNMFKKVGVLSSLVTTADDINKSQVLVIPGIGMFDNAVQQIKSMGLRSALEEAAFSRKIPILGICLGMQLMTRGSEEGRLAGLGWIRADTRLINGAKKGLRVPHMGWNVVAIKKPNKYFDGNIDEHRFYFVHSYAVYCDEPSYILATTQYVDEFVSAFAVSNLIGVQFHPEKSHKFGASFFRQFAKMCGLMSA
jgi:imidazole glycerol-phosphate synthase subunit HisH